MNKVAIAINVKFDRMDGRLWFEVSDADLDKFDRVCQQIKFIEHVSNWKSFITVVVTLFQQEGFPRIAK